MSWGHHCSTHGEKRQNCWRVGCWRLILLFCVVGGGCGWEKYCSVSSTLVKGQKQNGTQNCRSCYTKNFRTWTWISVSTRFYGFLCFVSHTGQNQVFIRKGSSFKHTLRSVPTGQGVCWGTTLTVALLKHLLATVRRLSSNMTMQSKQDTLGNRNLFGQSILGCNQCATNKTSIFIFLVNIWNFCTSCTKKILYLWCLFRNCNKNKVLEVLYVSIRTCRRTT